MKPGDRIKMLDGDRYCHGLITIVRTNDQFIRNIPNGAIICKVIFEEDWAPDYWYYPESKLELYNKEIKQSNIITSDRSPEPGLWLSLKELKALFRIFEHEYLPYNDEEIHAIIKKITNTIMKYDS
jgi:hypothetical protein